MNRKIHYFISSKRDKKIRMLSIIRNILFDILLLAQWNFFYNNDLNIFLKRIIPFLPLLMKSMRITNFEITPRR